MAARKLELDISDGMFLRCTVDNNSHSYTQDIDSSKFRFKGGKWMLNYLKRGPSYHLHLRKCSGVHPNPLEVSVHVESSGSGRIVNVLPQVSRFTTEFEDTNLWCEIWQKREEEILLVPKFRFRGILKLLVVLKLEEDSDIMAEWQRGVPEAAGQPSSTRSTSFQTTLPCLESLSEDLSQLMVEDPHHDVVFHCAGHSTRAHKSIVCKRSPVIASMLATDMVEGRTGVVNIPNMAPDIFAQFMRYIYSGQLEELTFRTALRLYEAGVQYEVLGLAKRCSEFLLGHLSVDNAYEVLVVADAHNNRECVEKVIDYMVESHVPWVSEEWSAFCDEHSKLANKVLNRALKAAVK